LYKALKDLTDNVDSSIEYSGSALAHYSRNEIIPAMEEVRKYADKLELIVDQTDWPYPTYGEMLFYV